MKIEAIFYHVFQQNIYPWALHQDGLAVTRDLFFQEIFLLGFCPVEVERRDWSINFTLIQIVEIRSDLKVNCQLNVCHSILHDL